MSDSGRHLDEEGWRALQRREPEAVAHFATHLARPCEACEAFLAREPEDDRLGLESLADEALAAVAGPAREDEVGWARVRRRLAPPRRAWLTGALAAAAAAVLVLLVRPGPVEPEHASSQRLKGGGPLALELAAAAQLPGGEVRAVPEDSRLPPEAVVLLRYHSSEAADALLVHESPGVPAQVLGRYALEPGTHDLRDGAELAGVSLEGEQGPVSLVLVAWPRGPGSREALEQALERGGVPPEAAQARVHLRVSPGQTGP
jgi:hypothetical protein